MRTMENKGLKYLILQILMFFVSNIGLFLSQFLVKSNGQKNHLLAIVAGVLFWGGLLSAIAFTLLLNKTVTNKSKDRKISLLVFFSNKISTVIDIIMIVSAIAFVIILFINNMSSVATTIFCIFIFSFEMHCIFNGKNYKYITSNLEENKDGKV